MMLPSCSIKECAKYQIDEQSRSLCVQKPGTADHYLSHVTRKSTKSSLDDFSWSSLLKKWKVHLLTCLISRPLWVYCCTRRWKSSTSSVYGYVMNIQCWGLNLVQNLITIILGIAHSNHKVSIILVTTSNFLEVVADWKKNHFTVSLFLEKQLYNLNLEISQA